MRPVRILQKALRDELDFLHTKRREAIFRAVTGVVRGGKVSLTALGRELPGKALEKHRIKAIDRLLGNGAVQAALVQLYGVLAAFLLAGSRRPVLLVDWSGCGPRHYLLAAAVCIGGRALPIHSLVVVKSKLAKREVHEEFLRQLREIVPAHCKPIIVTDAGFYTHWLQLVRRVGWDVVGRVRGRFSVELADGRKLALEEVHRLAKRRSCVDLGIGRAGVGTGLDLRLVLSPVPRTSGRRRMSRSGKVTHNTADGQRTRAAHEPWLLVTSLTCSPLKVIAHYKLRMQIEETFRDMKNHRFGLALEDVRCKSEKRIEVLLFLAAMGLTALVSVGIVAEKLGLQRRFQANTITKRRVLSLVMLGRRILAKAIPLPRRMLDDALRELQCLPVLAAPLEAAA